jgi:hypothetical protein
VSVDALKLNSSVKEYVVMPSNVEIWAAAEDCWTKSPLPCTLSDFPFICTFRHHPTVFRRTNYDKMGAGASVVAEDDVKAMPQVRDGCRFDVGFHYFLS